MSYTPNKIMIQKGMDDVMRCLCRLVPLNPSANKRDKYFFDSSRYTCDTDELVSEAELLRQYDQCINDAGLFGFMNYYNMVIEIMDRSSKLLLIMISDVKNTIDMLSGNESNISYLFYRGDESGEITNFEYRLPIIEAKMECPLRPSNPYIKVYWDLLQKLEAQLDARVGKKDKHEWIVKHLSFEREKDDNPEWDVRLQGFYEVRDERMRQEGLKKEDVKKESPKLSDEQMEQLANLQRSLTVLSNMVTDLSKSIMNLGKSVVDANM